VYRNLADLEEDGMVVKHIPNGTREVYYRYIGAEKCKGHIHVSCVKCGKTFHIKKDYVAVLSDSLKKDENFILSTEETILYGICGDCQGA
ncbi:MAG: Fur family transcriptional regulator, partial [Christensenellales bacterium]